MYYLWSETNARARVCVCVCNITRYSITKERKVKIHQSFSIEMWASVTTKLKHIYQQTVRQTEKHTLRHVHTHTRARTLACTPRELWKLNNEQESNAKIIIKYITTANKLRSSSFLVGFFSFCSAPILSIYIQRRTHLWLNNLRAILQTVMLWRFRDSFNKLVELCVCGLSSVERGAGVLLWCGGQAIHHIKYLFCDRSGLILPIWQ